MAMLFRYIGILASLYDEISCNYGICYKQETENGMSIVTRTCCPDFYMTEGSCTGCPSGYFGINCSNKCIVPYYGKGCLNLCECDGKSCNHVTGCTETAGKYWLTVGVPFGIFVIAGAVIANTLIRILKRRRMGNAELPLNELRNSSTAAGESNIYDEIDETMMNVVDTQQSADNKKNVQNIESTDSNSSGSTDTCAVGATDGYLNPYTPLVEDWQKHTHVYNDGYDLDEDTETRGYLNPYQPLTNEWQKHTHVYDHSSNGPSEQNNHTD